MPKKKSPSKEPRNPASKAGTKPHANASEVLPKQPEPKQLNEPVAPSAVPILDPHQTPAKPFPIVGIGASAGGLEAFTALLKNLSADTGMAFVLVQHMDPTHESMLNRLLSRDTKMPVTQVTDGMSVEQNHVYVIPPNVEMTIRSGILRLIARPGGAGRHTPIDTFLFALAEDQKAKAVGVILSGIGSDGTKGLQAIKAEGGITFAQDEESAKYPGMPLHAATAGCVDMALPPDKIARELARMLRHPYLEIAPQASPSEPLPEENGNLRKIFRLLRSATGVDFTNYKYTTVKRRIARRMLVRRCETLADYARYAAEHPDEVHALFQDVLIHVTTFFRESNVYQILQSTIFPRITSMLDPGDSIRIWVPGCSSGEEVYSTIIALLEHLGETANQARIQVFGTDISEADIQKARTAIYSESSVAEVSPERLRRYFLKAEGGYQISKSIRELCVYARHDVTKDPPFSRMDLISCRNLLIYMTPVLQKRILNYFHYALKPSGFLILGKSETVSAAPTLFTLVDREANVYSRMASPARPKPEFDIKEHEGLVAGTKAPPTPTAPSFDLRKEAQRILLDRYAPPALIVDGDLNVLHFVGDTSPFLKPAPGEASFHLLRLVRQELILEIRTAVQEAKKSRLPTRREGVRFKRNGHSQMIDIEVAPIDGRQTKGPDYVVLFQNARPLPEKQLKAAPKAKRSPEDEEIERLKHDLSASQDHLRTLLEEHEAASEELRAANEEILSSNEELQSTNEELETAKEELQSSNEELTTLNEELQNRNLELSQTVRDLNSVLNAVEVPTAVLDNERTIRRFTPAAGKLLNLIQSDIGRPIAQIRPSLNVYDLDLMAQEVITKEIPVEREAQHPKGHWYSLRMKPYRTDENTVDGVLIALVDIHDIKQYSWATVETMREGLLVLDRQFRVLSASPGFYKTFHTTDVETEGQLLWDLGNGQWNIPQLKELLEQILPQKKEVRDFQVQHDFPGIGMKTMLLNARQLTQIGTSSERVLLVIEDITERDLAVKKLTAEAASLARLNAASSRLWRAESLPEGLEELLTASIELVGADMGDIQLLDAKRDVMEIAAERGLGQEFLEFVREASAREVTASGRALRTGKRVIIEDVETDPLYAKMLPIARSVGYRSVQSTPIIGREGSVLGMISTYYRLPHRLSAEDLQRLDLYARQAAGFIERSLAKEDREQRLAKETKLREEAEKAKDELRFITERAEVGTWDWDLRSDALVWSRICKRLIGIPEDQEVSYKRFLAAVHPDDRDRTDQAVRACLEGGGKIDLDMDYRVQPSDGIVRWVRAKGNATFAAGKPVRMAGVVMDVTDRKHAEATHLQNQEDRRQTSVLEERARIARDIHDTLAQGFTGIVLNLEAAEGASKNLPAEVRDRIVRAKNVARSSLDEARRSVLTLALPNGDFMASMRELVDRSNSNKQTPVKLSVSGSPVSLPPSARQELIRIVQQAVDNAQQHAQASTIRLEVTFSEKQTRIRIRDDGQGFDVAKRGDRLGITSMRARAAEIGAKFGLISRPGKGTQIDVSVPTSNVEPRDSQ